MKKWWTFRKICLIGLPEGIFETLCIFAIHFVCLSFICWVATVLPTPNHHVHVFIVVATVAHIHARMHVLVSQDQCWRKKTEVIILKINDSLADSTEASRNSLLPFLSYEQSFEIGQVFSWLHEIINSFWRRIFLLCHCDSNSWVVSARHWRHVCKTQIEPALPNASICFFFPFFIPPLPSGLGLKTKISDTVTRPVDIFARIDFTRASTRTCTWHLHV